MTTTQLGYISSVIVGLASLLASLYLFSVGNIQSAIYWLLIAIYMRVKANEEK